MSIMDAKEARPVDDPKALVPFGWAPGGYYCAACASCGKSHSGSDKRSMRCQDCAEALRGKQPAETPSNANTSGLAQIISDDEILRVHGHANFGPQMTPREVVNEGVLKYAFGYHSGHTQLCILMAHGLITKPRPGSYDASLTKKGKRYARALGGYQNAVTAASAQDRIAELEDESEALTKALTGLTCGGSEFFTRKGDRYVADIKVCVDWVRRAKTDAHRRSVEAIKRATAAEARAERLAKALEPFAAEHECDGHATVEDFNMEVQIFVRWAIIKEARAALQQEG